MIFFDEYKRIGITAKQNNFRFTIQQRKHIVNISSNLNPGYLTSITIFDSKTGHSLDFFIASERRDILKEFCDWFADTYKKIRITDTNRNEIKYLFYKHLEQRYQTDKEDGIRL